MNKPLSYNNQPLYITSFLLAAFGMDYFANPHSFGLYHPMLLLMFLLALFSAIGIYTKRVWMLRLLGQLAPWLLVLGGGFSLMQLVSFAQGLSAGVELNRNTMLGFVLDSSYIGCLVLVLHALALWGMMRHYAQLHKDRDTDQERELAEMALSLRLPRWRTVLMMTLLLGLVGLGARLWCNPWSMLLQELRIQPELANAVLSPNCITPTVLWSSPLDPVLTTKLEIRHGDQRLYYIGMVRPWAGEVSLFPVPDRDK